MVNTSKIYIFNSTGKFLGYKTNSKWDLSRDKPQHHNNSAKLIILNNLIGKLNTTQGGKNLWFEKNSPNKRESLYFVIENPKNSQSFGYHITKNTHGHYSANVNKRHRI